MSSSSRKMLQAAAGAGGAGFYPYTVDYSARFNDDDSAYLSKVFGSPTDQNVFTLSFWVKRANISAYMTVFSAGSATGQGRGNLGFESGNIFRFNWDNAGSPPNTYVATTQVFRDTGAWQHIVIAVNTDDSTAADRVKIYVNGSRVTSLSGTVYPGSGDLWDFNKSGVTHNIGRRLSNGPVWYCDLYLSEFAFVDGQALTPSSFGDNKNGVWIPKDLSSGITWGNNGFYLDFSNSAALGTDVSGNGNNFTSSGLTSSDQMIDTPSNNFATLNPLLQFPTAGGLTGAMYNGNLEKYGPADNSFTGAYSTIAMPPNTGKWYSEHYVVTENRNAFGITYAPTDAGSMNPNNSTTYGYYLFCYSGWSYSNLYATSSTLVEQVGNLNAGGIVSILYDSDNLEVTFFVNGTQAGSTMSVPSATYLFFADGYGVSPRAYNVSNFGQDSTFGGRITAGGNSDANGIGDFKYTVPTDALALCTANLPEPTIGPNSAIKPEDCFATVLYTGNGTAIGSGGKAVTGVGFQPDMVWIKNRDAADQWMCFDSVRGATKYLSLDDYDLEVTDTETLSTFDTDGFTLGNNVAVNTSGEDYVAYCFKITAGFFDIVTYTGNVTNRTIPHSLGVEPNFLITKSTTTGTAPYGWFVYCSSLPVTDPETDFMQLEITNPAVDQADIWNDTAPTSSVFSVGTNGVVNKSGDTYIAYLFADVEGFCKTGYYKGNGSTDGPFEYLGFSPELHIIKQTNAVGGWFTLDTEREPYNPTKTWLYLDTNGSENLADIADLNSNGSKLRFAGGGVNVSSNDYITLSIGTSSKYSNAR